MKRLNSTLQLHLIMINLCWPIRAKKSLRVWVLALGLIAPALSLAQGNADVIEVQARQSSDQSWTFTVTVLHPDTGWEDYANGWDVVLPNGQVIKPEAGSQFTRTLWHPHVGEQPFTRSQSGIVIPQQIKQVTVRAHDTKDGFGGKEKLFKLAP